ncbi:hypothetical protein R1flu_002934 [Riccia fluitans]|uniref:Fungal lipase-type domain-containing protein n=1 Tax=Riccia fluitans TaxID=41844 RepID=A0ABD1YBA9_9MARC
MALVASNPQVLFSARLNAGFSTHSYSHQKGRTNNCYRRKCLDTHHLQSSVHRFGNFSSVGAESRRYRKSSLALTCRASVSSASPSGGFNFRDICRKIFINVGAAFARFSTEFYKLRIGIVTGADIVAMVRLLLLGCTAFVAYVASKRAWAKIKEHAVGKGSDDGGGGPMQVLARGATCVQSNMGPWSLQDFTLGLAAMAKVTEKEPPELPGKEVDDLSRDPEFLMRAQHWRSMAEAAYAKDSGSFSLFSHLPESSIIASEWDPCQDSFRPAYVVFVDAPMDAVVLAVRGTSHVIDMLLNSGASPEPFCNGSAHGGFIHGANVLYEEALPHLEKGFSENGDRKLIITGHSMGAAVGAMCGLRLREKFPDLECWAFCPPACLTLDLAQECRQFVTSFVAAHDLVPRFSLKSVENLRQRINEFDWDRAERVAKDDPDWQNIKKALDTMRACQQTQEDAMKAMNDKGEQVSKSEAGQKAKELGGQVAGSGPGQKVKELGQQAGDQLADSEAAQKVKGMGQQANDYIQGNDCDTREQKEEQGSVPPFYPPGRLLVLGSEPPGCGKMPEQRSNVASERNYGCYPTFDEAKRIRWVMHEVEQEELEEIVVSPWCISDHMLGNLCEGIGYFQGHCSPALSR